MARQIVDIGLEGNDNTGDSIRESFRKVNQNFSELYAVFGMGGQISITDLNDIPEYTTGNKILAVNPTANGIDFLDLTSDGSLEFEFVTVEGIKQLRIKQISSNISTDTTPELGGHVNAKGFAIANVAVSEEAANSYNDTYSPNPPITIDKLVITKEYADRNYLAKTVPGPGTRLGNEPEDVSQYTRTATGIANNNLVIVNHGLTSAYDGLPFIFRCEGNAPTGLVNGNTYFIRVVDSSSISLHSSTPVNTQNKINISGGTPPFTITDAAYDPLLLGNWLSNEALPRKSIVRRQGDRMEGALYLHDHPGDLSGNENDNIDDLQAATKLYVDSVSSASQVNLFVKVDGDDSQMTSPFGKEGRSPAYAYKTIGAAARRAEEIVFSSPIEPGPYVQTITHSSGNIRSTVQDINFVNQSVANRVNARTLILRNKKFLQKETIAYLKETYPQYIFDEEEVEQDIGLAIESVTLDIIAGDAANYLSRTFGIRYYYTAESKKYVTTYKNQTIDSFEFLRDTIVSKILTNQLITNPRQTVYNQVIDNSLTIDPVAGSAIQSKFGIIILIVNNGIFSSDIIDGANTYKIYISNGDNGSVDQGVSANSDILPGKLVRGKVSGALGRIISYTRESDQSIVAGSDQLEMQLVEPIDFLEGEEIEYGSVSQTSQITINVESGIYHEDYPIRIAPNVSVNGDEFRRVIIRPKNRVSQSPYADTYFYRDANFDGLDLFQDKNSNILLKGTEYVNPLTNQVDGYFGYHYLADSSKRSNTGIVYENFGKWIDAYKAIIAKKDEIVGLGIGYFEEQNPLITVYDKFGLTVYLDKIVEAIAKDLLVGGKEFSLEMQGNYWRDGVSISQSVVDVVNFISTEIKNSVTASEPPVWSANTQYLRNSIIKIAVGGSFEYYRSRIVHVSGSSFDTTEKNLYWIQIAGIPETIDNLTGTIVFAYDEEYNPPKHNRDMDVFLMNDSTILRNITVQGHGGFMCVLDPQGQILNKSPYIQTGSSFSQSINKQAFRGGMFVDGFVGNLAMKVVGKVAGDPFRLIVESDTVNYPGLLKRKPETPCSFYIDGNRFQVNAITNYDQTAGTAILLLDKTSNKGIGFTGLVNYFGTTYDLGASILNVPIVLQTAGNRSMLGNDFTQINDLGYGLVCANGALSEMVSMFTYYCHTGYYAKSGSEIRSLTGSTCYGQYGLVSEGADPNEIPDDIKLVHDMVQPARVFEAAAILYMNNPVSVVAGNTLKQTRTIGGETVEVFADVVVSMANSPVIYVKNIQNGSFDTVNAIENISTSVNLGTAYEVDNESYLNTLNSLAMYVFDMKDVPLSNSELDIYHPIRSIVARYEIRNVVKTDAVVGQYKEINTRIPVTRENGTNGSGAIFSIQKTRQSGYTTTIETPGLGYSAGNIFKVAGNYLGGSSPTNDATITVVTVDGAGRITSVSTTGTIFVDENTPRNSGQVYRLNFSRTDAQFSTLGLLEEVEWYTGGGKTTIDYRKNENHIIEDINNPETLTIRPSTALIFDEFDTQVYRTVSFTQQDSIGTELDEDTVQVSFDSPFDYIKLNIDGGRIDDVDPDNAAKTLGATVGDTNIALRPITELSSVQRLNNTPHMIFTWKGAKYRITNYREIILPGETDPVYGIITIQRLEDILSSGGTGLTQPVSLAGVDQITLRAGIPAGSDGDITFNISTCRATSHDFLDVGKGGYNAANFPNVIFGQAVNETVAESTTEVVEVGKGRVFYVSTDQNGVFRVGRFFTVDQGTGTVSFAASIALNDIDGIGFKRGVTVSEFSTDSALSDNDENTVPVESAVRGYVARRLGFKDDGNPVGNTIGPGVMALNGQSIMLGDINLGGNKIINVADPRLGLIGETDAVNRKYVDGQIAASDELAELLDVDLTRDINDNVPDGNLLVFTGDGSNSINATVAGTITFTRSGNTLTSSIATGAVTNTMVNANAGIAQSKLSLNAATTRANATGIAQSDLGVASFDSAFFDSTSGWISLKNNGITLGKLATVASGTVLGRIAAGSGSVSAISIGDAINDVGGVVDADFTTVLGNVTTPGSALTKTGEGTYGITNISRTNTPNSIVKTDNSGKIQVTSVILGGTSTQEILALNGLSTVLKTPAQGIILTAEGTDAVTTPTVTFPRNVVIGTGVATKSTLQSTAGSTINNSSRLKVDWIHTSFIEAAKETANASSTGIAIGADTGKTIAGEIGIITESAMPFKFSATGVVPDFNNVYNIGSETRQYKDIWAETFNGTATSAYYADLAENYLADTAYEPGTVVVFGGDQEVTVSNEKGTHRAAGVVSTHPAHLMNSMLKGDHVVALALQGRVPCKVVGVVKKGDLLVNSGVAGYACVDNSAKAGTIIGKALENKNDAGKGIIEVVVGKH